MSIFKLLYKHMRLQIFLLLHLKIILYKNIHLSLRSNEYISSMIVYLLNRYYNFVFRVSVRTAAAGLNTPLPLPCPVNVPEKL